MISFSCSKCGKQYNLKPDFAGRKTTCSGCKDPLVVPSPEPPPVATEANSRIAFSCAKCGMKFNLLPAFAGRKTSCPTCKSALVVPALDQTAALVPTAGRLDGPSSSLAQAHVDADVTLAGNAGTSALPGLIGAGARYIIDKELARGGMGAVLRAIDCDIRREVAVKYLLDQTNAKNKIRFVEEAQITGQLEHPNIVPIHELGVDSQKRIFFTMKMVKGRSIAQVVKMLRDQPEVAEKEYTLSRLLNIFVSICNALAYAHSRGVVHRDLKPANVMVGDFGEVYVMDWGLAKVLGRAVSPISVADDMTIPEAQLADVPSATLATSLGSGNVMTSREADADLTQAGAVMGTPVYMPPEQAAGRIDEIDERSDIYSMGAVLYELLTLQAPIDKTGGFWPIVMRVGQGKIDAPEKKSPERALTGKIPPELAAVAMKALAKEKRDRYQTIEALRKDIERFTEGRSVSAKVDTIREMAVKLVKRNKPVSIATAAAFAMLLVVASFFLKINYDARRVAEKANADYLAEQDARRAQGKNSAPTFLEDARQSVLRKNLDHALTQVNVALEFDPELTDAWLLKGQLQLSDKKFDKAQKSLTHYLKRKPGDANAKKLAELCGRANLDDVAGLMEFSETLARQKAFVLSEVMLAHVGDRKDFNQRLFRLYQERLDAAWPGSGAKLRIDGNGKMSLDLREFSELVTDLTPLRGMKLHFLDLNSCKHVADLTPLEGMPLTTLTLSFCSKVSDLSALTNMQLTKLALNECRKIKDLTPLQGMPLQSLDLNSSGGVSDLTLLRGMPLSHLILRYSAVSDLSPLEGMKIMTLSLEFCAKVTNLAPLKGMPLTQLNLNLCSKVSDLSPLEGMKLKSLNLSGSQVKNLTPLKGMPLTSLILTDCFKIDDLAPLEGTLLTDLDLWGCSKVYDLTPLRGMKFTRLRLKNTQVKDLTPLKDMPLTELNAAQTQVQDLSPLKDMPLTVLSLAGKTLSDLRPLQRLKLTSLDLSG